MLRPTGSSRWSSMCSQRSVRARVKMRNISITRWLFHVRCFSNSATNSATYCSSVFIWPSQSDSAYRSCGSASFKRSHHGPHILLMTQTIRQVTNRVPRNSYPNMMSLVQFMDLFFRWHLNSHPFLEQGLSHFGHVSSLALALAIARFFQTLRTSDCWETLI